MLNLRKAIAFLKSEIGSVNREIEAMEGISAAADAQGEIELTHEAPETRNSRGSIRRRTDINSAFWIE